MSNPTFEDWTDAWPTEPGTYLFWGDYGNPSKEKFQPSLKVVTVREIGPPSHRSLMYVGDGAFMYRSEQTGLFKRCTIETPDWPKNK